MDKKQKLVKYLNGVGDSLKLLSKEVDGLKEIDKESLELMKNIGSDLVFKGVSIDFTEINKVDELAEIVKEKVEMIKENEKI